MKVSLIVIFASVSISFFGQDLKSDLQGKWICNKIIDSVNHETEGKYGKSGQYLQFLIEKSSLSAIHAPFDRGLPVNFSLSRSDSILDLFPGSVYPVPERTYKVKYLSGKFLILKTVSAQNRSIYYVFTNQNEYAKKMNDSMLIDCGTILIKHLKLDKNSPGANKVSEYYPDKNPNLFYPTPVFADNSSTDFGFYVSINFNFPKDYKLDSLSKELTVEFTVSQTGAGDIKIIKSLNKEIDQNIIKILEKAGKKWKPVIINEKPIMTKLRFHFYFYEGLSVLPINFK